MLACMLAYVNIVKVVVRSEEEFLISESSVTKKIISKSFCTNVRVPSGTLMQQISPLQLHRVSRDGHFCQKPRLSIGVHSFGATKLKICTELHHKIRSMAVFFDF